MCSCGREILLSEGGAWLAYDRDAVQFVVLCRSCKLAGKNVAYMRLDLVVRHWDLLCHVLERQPREVQEKFRVFALHVRQSSADLLRISLLQLEERTDSDQFIEHFIDDRIQSVHSQAELCHHVV